MKCPFCGYTESKVIDTRPTDEGERIRRRRECLQCGKRFTSYEVVETTPVMVIKKDGSREAFSHEIEVELQNRMDREVPSAVIGELVMEKLKKIDQVAYVRFASVYREFKDINSFLQELKVILEHEKS